MDKLYLAVVVCLLVESVELLSLPGPLVYVVTPRTVKEQARSSPFYYHNWMRRMDSANDTTTTTTTTTQRVKTPDLIFAEFEAGNEMDKSLKKLLQKERIQTTTTTTSKPIYVPEEVPEASEAGVQTYGLPTKDESNKPVESSSDDMEDYFAQYNNLYNAPAPVYLPSTTTRRPTTTTTTTTTTPAPTPAPTAAPMNVENIWHVIDNEKYDQQYSGKWEEVPINDDSSKNVDDNNQKNKEEDGQIEENFALPGFSTNPGKGAENESRAIRTEPNYRFPYVNLKTFQMKNPNPPNSLSTSKKGNNMFYNLDNFQDVKNPVRGEAQEVVTRQDPIDRYNPAQPYLPVYGTKSKQSSAEQPKATKTVANLIPPPPPPQSSDSLLPPPTYDSFPPYAPPQPSASQPPAAPPVASKPDSVYQPPLNADAYDSPPADGDDDGPPAVNPGYRYNKPPSIPNFVPTLPPPPAKPFPGYSYDKPPMDTDDSPPDSQSFKGYSYDQPPADSPPPMADKPSYGGYHDHPPSYGPAPPSYSSHDSDYPELIFNKPHGGKGLMKGGDDMKGNDMGMMPPPPPDAGDAPGPPSHDGFPQDFPGDFKYHDFDHDHDHYHYHHPTTTTTTTTETPRVNRYSYYYLGKKLYYLPLYFSVYFIVYVGALIIKAVLRHKIVYPNSWRPNDTTSTFFTKRSADWEPSSEALHDVTRRVTRALAAAAEKYMENKQD